MKSISVAVFFSAMTLFWSGLHAQPAPPTGQSPVAGASQPPPEAERARISAERRQLEVELSAAESACYKDFFVNDCLEKVKSRRYEVMGALRRQEVILNAQDRRAKGAEQIRKTEEKSSPEKVQQDLEKRSNAVMEFQSRTERDKQKTADRAAAQASEQANREAAAQRLKNNQEKAAERALKQIEATEAVKKSNERQQQARERQARYERDKLERTKPLSKPLPVPP